MSVRILQGDARSLPLPDASVQMVVTSPPYWGLRAYEGEQCSVWDGKPKCDHDWADLRPRRTDGHTDKRRWNHAVNGRGEQQPAEKQIDRDPVHVTQGQGCWKCGAWYGSYGLEPFIELYVGHSIEILREIRRVLRPDGIVFWNVGDSYSGSGSMGSGGSYGSPKQASNRGSYFATNQKRHFGEVKPKDLCLIPERVAIAAQADGWWVRSMILWAKPNPMPESVTDRPTDAYEHIIMLAKSDTYFWDADAVREPAVAGWNGSKFGGDREKAIYRNLSDSPRNQDSSTRNIRNVWEFPTQPFPGAHFATFPEELPRRCILAATSERGACLQCGAPWRRVVKAEGGTIGEDWNKNPERGAMDMQLGNRASNAMKQADAEGSYQRRTVGWTPTCLCKGQHGKTRPCLVLDPFGGSGTTGRVAVELNREAVIVDLHYHELAERRTRNVQRRLL